MTKRSTRAQIARETLDILERGSFTSPAGRMVALADELASARSRSVLYTPEQMDEVLHRCKQLLAQQNSQPLTTFEVTNETTLAAARRLVQDGHTRVLALNFASARNPGGGFLNGSHAQEESLARASGLYACLAAWPQMYEANRRFPSCLYTDHMIYSPDVPVFRDDDDLLLEVPYRVSFLTAPAVNAGAVRRNESGNVGRIQATMLARMEKLLALAVVHGHNTLVLGAWGCGVFANNPGQVASWFAQHLTGTGLFRTAFARVVFAVWDTSPSQSTIQPFVRLFADKSA